MKCEICGRIRNQDYCRVEIKEWVKGVLETDNSALLCAQCGRLPKKYIDRYCGRKQ